MKMDSERGLTGRIGLGFGNCGGIANHLCALVAWELFDQCFPVEFSSSLVINQLDEQVIGLVMMSKCDSVFYELAAH
ncbi:hypothetical protein Sjap_007035 [Stephania japonica]|uniref:Uncharacterized protein n=1 Tax=Stephania japonica TaxID=461633 RepID=A0AAP0K708_9MAGN